MGGDKRVIFTAAARFDLTDKCPTKSRSFGQLRLSDPLPHSCHFDGRPEPFLFFVFFPLETLPLGPFDLLATSLLGLVQLRVQGQPTQVDPESMGGTF